MPYNSNKGIRYNQAVTRKIIKKSIAKNRAKREALEEETLMKQAMWESCLADFAQIQEEDLKLSFATKKYLEWQMSLQKP